MFDVIAFSTNALTYQWQRGGVDILGATNATFVASNAQPGDFALYSVAVSSDGRTALSSTAALTMLPVKPVLSIARRETNVLLSWPAAYSGYGLEQSTNLAPNTWSWVSQSGSSNDDRVVVTVPMSVSTFYRLRTQ